MCKRILGINFLFTILLVSLPRWSLAQMLSDFPSISGEVAGTLVGMPSVSSTGSFEYNLDLMVPPGTNGMTPKLSLSYDSRGQDGLVGMGWTLEGLSQVSRCPSTIALDGFVRGVQFDGMDKYCLDGQRFLSLSGPYGADGSRYLLQSDNLTEITSFETMGTGPGYFRVRSKDSTIAEYGVTTDSRVHPQSRTEALIYNVNKVSDRTGNYMKVEYQTDHSVGESYPLQILYTGNDVGRLSPFNSVRFSYINRVNPIIHYVSGSGLTRSKLLSRIEMWNGSTKAYEYRLTYENDPLTSQPQLVSLQQCGNDGVCLPATRFTWSRPNTSIPFLHPWPTIPGFSPSDGYTDTQRYPVLSGDWDGDGRTDFARMGEGGISFQRAFSNGFTAFGWLDFYSPSQGFTSTNSYPILVGDWNGDGKSDLARVIQDRVITFVSSSTSSTLMFNRSYDLPDFGALQGFSDASLYPIVSGDWNSDGRSDIARVTDNGLRFYISTETGFTFLEDLNDFGRSSNYPNSEVAPLLVGDWNGDGVTDVGRIGPSSAKFYVLRPQGVLAMYADIPSLGSNILPSASTYPIVTGDWNGDGLTDIGRVHSSGTHLFTSFGAGFGPSWNFGGLSPAQGYGDSRRHPLIAADWNGDGMTDLARFSDTGLGVWAIKNGTSSYLLTTLQDLSPNQGFIDETTTPLVFGDWNGDGYSDIGRVSVSGGVRHFTYGPGLSHNLLRVSNGLGNIIDVEYSNLTDTRIYEKGSGATYPDIDAQLPIRVVSRIGQTNGLGTISYQSYRYSTLRQSLIGLGSYGFLRMDTIDEDSGKLTQRFFYQDHRLRGKTAVVSLIAGNGNLLNRKTDYWTSPGIIEGVFRNTLLREVEEQFEANGTLYLSKTTDWTYDGYGSPTQIKSEYSDGQKETITSTYINDESLWMLGQVVRLKVTKEGPNTTPTTRTTAISYRNGTGLIAQEITEPDSASLRLVKSYEYNVFGGISKVSFSGPTIPSYLAEQQIFDPSGRFVVQKFNPYYQVESREYDERFGLPTKITDANGVVGRKTYDQFGRISTELRTDGASLRSLYLKPPANSLSNAAYMIRVDAHGVGPSVKYYDELARLIRSESTGFDGQKIIVDQVYDVVGRTVARSEPYFEGTSPSWTATEYDLKDRPVVISAPGNRISRIDYAGLTTTETSPLGQKTVKNLNSVGKMTYVIDSANKTTSYNYDGAGNLTKITDCDGNVTTMVYDVRDNKIEHVDPDAGRTVYRYDALGRMLESQDFGRTTNSPRLIKYTYDMLNRMIKRTSPEGVETWTYDTALYGKGRLHKVAGLSGYSETLSYDALGRNIRETRVIAGTTFNTDTSYDLLSRPDVLTYPSGYKVQYVYNPRGFLSAIKRVSDGTILWQPRKRNAKGQLLEEGFANGLIQSREYDSSLGVLTRVSVPTILDLRFQFDRQGNLVSRRDELLGLSEDFRYDGLNRLISSRVAGAAEQSIVYSSLGNILSRSDRGTYTYSSNGVGPHAVTSISGAKADSFSYDSWGNRISSIGETIQYNSSNLPLKIDTTTKRVTFGYGPDHQRVLQVVYNKSKSGALTQEEEKIYVGSLFERVKRPNKTDQIHYLKSTDGLISINTNGVSVYVHTDHLGSISAVTTQTGQLAERLSYDSWGSRRDPLTWQPVTNKYAISTDRGFTGHEHIEETSIIHMNGRVYDPQIGRFLSVDPIVQEPDNMQNLNRYTYVLNNPLSLVDPSGLSFFSKVKRLVGVALSAAAFVVASNAFPGAPVFAKGLFAGFASGAVSSLVNGGRIADALKAGFRTAPFSAVSSFASFQIGEAYSLGQISRFDKLILHAASGGIIGAGQGNSLLGGVASSFSADLTGSAGYLATALAGGTAAALSGGKFEDGVVSSLVVKRFNHDLHENADEQLKRQMLIALRGPLTNRQLSGIFLGGMADFMGDVNSNIVVLAGAIGIPMLWTPFDIVELVLSTGSNALYIEGVTAGDIAMNSGSLAFELALEKKVGPIAARRYTETAKKLFDAGAQIYDSLPPPPRKTYYDLCGGDPMCQRVVDYDDAAAAMAFFGR